MYRAEDADHKRIRTMRKHQQEPKLFRGDLVPRTLAATHLCLWQLPERKHDPSQRTLRDPGQEIRLVLFGGTNEIAELVMCAGTKFETRCKLGGGGEGLSIEVWGVRVLGGGGGGGALTPRHLGA